MRQFLFQGLAFGALIARMPAVFTNYPATMRPAVAGMRATEFPAKFISRNVEPADGIGFGVAVAQGTRDESCVVAGAATTEGDFLGFTVIERTTRPDNPDRFGQYESARIMTEGDLWVAVGGAVGAGDPVHVLAGGAVGNAGGFAIPGARFESSTTGAGIAKIRF